jgi:hypothetical protein
MSNPNYSGLFALLLDWFDQLYYGANFVFVQIVKGERLRLKGS